MISPVFNRIAPVKDQQRVALILSVTEQANVTSWCSEIGSFLSEKGIKATVFFTGKIADFYPWTVSSFENDVDIGSMTYGGADLVSIPDYTIQLDEVKRGKEAVEESAGLSSKIFSAPYGSVNEDIYSLLNRSDILADFSYNDHYNKLYNGQFIRMELKVYEGADSRPENILSLTNKEMLVALRFNNSVSASRVIAYISSLRSGGVQFLNASEITGLELTLRGV